MPVARENQNETFWCIYSSIDPQSHFHLFIDFIRLILHIIATVAVELNLVTGKWSPALKIYFL